MKDQFEEPLKKLSRKDGQILIKLINRQTDRTTFELVKDLKSGWSAFWNQQAAKLFDLNLKTRYAPADEIEDFYRQRQRKNGAGTGHYPPGGIRNPRPGPEAE